MGACEEEGMSEHKTMMSKEKSANPENFTRKKLLTCSEKNRAGKNRTVCILIVVLILVIIGQIAALIVVWTRSISRHMNNEVGEHSIITCAPDNRTEIKNQKSAPCEDDWIWYRGKCYYFPTELDTWRNSEKFCKSHNSSLAIIESKEELDFLFRYKGTGNHWIGMRRTDDNTAWTWTDGSLYNENLFKIRRTPQEDIEHVYLNSKDVGSDRGLFHFKWICNKK